MGLFSSIVRPSQLAPAIGAKRTGIFQSIFPAMKPSDATGVFSNPAMIPHLPARPTSPATPAPIPETRKSAGTRAAEAVAAHLATYPKPSPNSYVAATRANTAPRKSAGTKNTEFANSVLAAGGSNVQNPGGLFSQQNAEDILRRNPLAPNVRDTAQMRPGPSSPFLNALAS